MMALRALKPCKSPGCPQLTRDPKGYCVDHIQTASNHSDYKRNRTDRREQLFYASTIWLKTRSMALRRDHGLCQHCLRDGEVKVADMVHHAISIKADWSLRLVLSNLLSLCNRCHQREERRIRIRVRGGVNP